MATDLIEHNQPHNFDPQIFKLKKKMKPEKYGPLIIQKALDHKLITPEEVKDLADKSTNEKMPSWLSLQMVENIIKLKYVTLYEAGHFDEINKAANKDDSLFNNL